jgi:gliding motility-associated-like protein
MTIHPKTGVINFTPAQQEIDVLAVVVEEFRYDSALFIWVPIGSSNRDMMIQIEPTCSPQAQAGVILDFNAPGTYPDPVSGLPTIDYNCLDSSVVMNFGNKLDCSTISPDGTDFRLTAPTSQPIPIKEIISICDANNETEQLLLKLHKPLAVNGKYFLYSKIGNDGNTLLNKCGFPMSEFDTIQLNVQGCFNMQMDIKNVWVNDDIFPVVEWKADTSSYPTYLFDKFVIHRKGPGGAYQQIGQQFDQYKNEYFDQALNGMDVDANEYEYKVEMILNNTAMGKTRDITSILLETSAVNCDTVYMNWTKYNGWGNPEYTIYYGEDDGLGGITWTADNTVPITDTFYVFSLDATKEAGNYKLKVESVDPSATYTAVSNWMTCDKTVPPPPIPVEPEDPVVPNVFTPNNDGKNDLLTIKPLLNWNTKRYVSIQNRWGVQVFETDSYDNSQAWDGTDKGGNDVADGVYFIVLEFEDQATGRTFKHTGTVTLMRNSN